MEVLAILYFPSRRKSIYSIIFTHTIEQLPLVDWTSLSYLVNTEIVNLIKDTVLQKFKNTRDFLKMVKNIHLPLKLTVLKGII